MKKKIKLLIPAIFIPSVVFAHNPGGALLSWVMMFGISLVASLLLLTHIAAQLLKNHKKQSKFGYFQAIFVS